jgi:hypothetical protein
MEKTSSRTWEDAWRELEITVDQGELMESISPGGL